MTLKLSNQQAGALFDLFNDMVLLSYVYSFEDKLVLRHMISIYKKLRSKCEGEPRKSYSITITDCEALAYRIYWRDHDISHCQFEWAFIVTHCMRIDLELNSTHVQINNTYKLLNQNGY